MYIWQIELTIWLGLDMDVGEGAVLFVLSEPLDVRGEYLQCKCDQITQIHQYIMEKNVWQFDVSSFEEKCS